ncbi:velvet factor-domain-containing protein [Cerioporus squamosus]|nr:velvet factor-domain-containing protein [Cerioporus squamosus]
MLSEQGPYTVPLSVGPSTIGGPIYFTHGPFAGRTVRTSAAELQKADAGRKFARKDRRALDPPPVVQVRIFEVLGAGTSTLHEQEIMTYDDSLTTGLVCHVELFPIVVETGADGTTRDRPMTDLLAAHSFISPSLSTLSSTNANVSSMFPPPLQAPTAATASVPVLGWMNPGTSTYPSDNSDIVAYYGNYPITESSNATGILAGTRVATAITLDHNNRGVLAFTFSDLAVQQEGTFTLRYRVVDILSKTTENGGLSYRIPVLASCFGGVFKVWSTKTFPGLPGSTALTKRLSLFGAAVTLRSPDHRNGQKRKRKLMERSESPVEAMASPESLQTASSPADSVSLSPRRTPNPEWAQAGYPWLWRNDMGPSGSGGQV